MRRLVFRTIIVGLMAFMLSLDVVLAQSNTRSSGSNNNTTTIDVLQLLKNAAEKSEARKKQSDEKKNTGKNSKKDRSSSSSMNEARDAFINDREKRNTTTSTKKTDNSNPTISSAKATTAQTNNQKAADDITLVVDGEGKDKTEATKNALRSAIEQSYGTFVSANTVILNDELVKDEIATVSSGNIKSYKELSSTTLQNGNSSVTLSATVSIGKLISYAQSKGASAEFAGQAFMMNMKMRELNKRNEAVALMHILQRLSSTYETLFDYSIKVGEASESGPSWLYNNISPEQHYFIPLTITVSPNDNYRSFMNYVVSTLRELSLTEEETRQYKQNGTRYQSVRWLIRGSNVVSGVSEGVYLRNDIVIDYFLQGMKAILSQAEMNYLISIRGLGGKYAPGFYTYTNNGYELFRREFVYNYYDSYNPFTAFNLSTEYLPYSINYEGKTYYYCLLCSKETETPIDKIEGFDIIPRPRKLGTTIPGFYDHEFIYSGKLHKKAKYNSETKTWGKWVDIDGAFSLCTFRWASERSDIGKKGRYSDYIGFLYIQSSDKDYYYVIDSYDCDDSFKNLKGIIVRTHKRSGDTLVDDFKYIRITKQQSGDKILLINPIDYNSLEYVQDEAFLML